MNKKSNSYKNLFLGDDRLSNPNIQTAVPTVDSNRGGEAMSQFFFASELDGTPISRCEPNKKDVEKKGKKSKKRC